jgi:hypothetical protein
MLWILIGLGLFLLYLWLKRSKRGKKVAAAGRHPIEGWIEESLARELAQKVDVESDVLLRTLQGAPEPEAVSALEEAVKSVEVRFSRLPDGTQVEVRMEAVLEAGGACSATKKVAFTDLPASIRGELQRTGGAMMFRSWDFPWSRPGAAWAE